MPAPLVPMLGYPGASAVFDGWNGINFGWTFRPGTPGDTQGWWQLQIRAVGGADNSWYSWNGSTWVADPNNTTYVSGNALSASIPALKWMMDWNSTDWRKAHGFLNPYDDSAGFEGGVGSWVADTNCSVSSSTTMADQGTHSLRLSSTAAGDMVARAPSGATSWALVNSYEQDVICRVRSGAQSRVATLMLDCFTSGGALTGTFTSDEVQTSTTEWQSMMVKALIPAGTAYSYYRIRVKIAGCAGASELHYFDIFASNTAKPQPYTGLIKYPSNWRMPFEWRMRTRSASGYWSPFSTGNIATVIQAPVCTVVAPTGSQATSYPVIAWTFAQEDLHHNQAGYRAKLFTAAQYGAGGFDPETSEAVWDSGQVAAADANSVTIPVAVANSTTYRAYVKLLSTSTQYSNWAYSGFTTSFVVPSAPTCVATPDANSSYFTVVITSNISGTCSFTLERSEDGGTTWVGVRGALPSLPPSVTGSPAALTIVDRSITYFANIRYRARVISTQAVASNYTTTADQQLTSTVWWLRSVDNSAYDLSFAPSSVSFKRRGGTEGSTFWPVGRSEPVVVHGNESAGDVFRFETHTLDKTQYDKVMRLLTSRGTLFLQSIHGMSWFVRVTGEITSDQVLANPAPGEVYRVRHYYVVQAELTEVGPQ